MSVPTSPENPPPPVPATTANAKVSPIPSVPAPEPLVPPSALTPEEQMALFEKELKETDWGHQPC